MSGQDGSGSHLPPIPQMTARPLVVIRDPVSPPKAQVDEASLQQAMDKNKESLKLKLMSRRPIHQLVEQGIMPSLKVPPHYYEQSQKLERAKRTDFLKHKIQKRPDRQALIQQHILEDTTIDPSLQDKQRQLKKARLADDLNDRLSHRPGPLELVKGNILHTDEKFAQAVKEGQIPFKRTCEGQAQRHPVQCFVFEDDSGSDVTLSPPQDVLDHSFGSMPSVETMVQSPYPNHDSPSSGMGELRITTPVPPPSQPVVTQQPITTTETTHKETSSSSARRKKSKPKPQPKTRMIKFHEYKGPPSAQKSQNSPTDAETSYELLLQQQQLFLQWQLEMQQKYPQVILPSPTQPQTPNSGDQLRPLSSSIEKQPDTSHTARLFEDFKVNGLKAELKKRNLPVSGPKVKLIERLMQHIESTNNNNKVQPVENMATIETTPVPINLNGIILDSLPKIVPKPEPAIASVVTVEAPRTVHDATVMVYNTVPVHGQIVNSRPSSVSSMDVDVNSVDMDCSENANDDIVKRQQQKIQQLERELEKSQRQLQQQQWWQQQQRQRQQQQVLLTTHPVPIAPAPPPPTRVAVATISQPTSVGQAVENLQHLLQLKNQSQQLMQQAAKYPPGSAEHSAYVKSSLAAFLHAQKANNIRLQNGGGPLGRTTTVATFPTLKPIILCPAQTVPAVLEKPRANSLPNGTNQQKLVWSSSVPNFSNMIAPKLTLGIPEQKPLIQKTAPERPQVQIKQEKQTNSKKSGRRSVKNQEVEDVLDVLISHGELPPSAADTPTTPETAKGTKAPPVFPVISNIESALSEPDVEVKSEMPPPPPLVFDLHLDLDLEDMDLGVLAEKDLQQHHNNSTPSFGNLDFDALDPKNMASGTSQQDFKNNATSEYQQGNLGLDAPNQTQNNSTLDLDMDVELTDWLDVLTNNSNGNSSNAYQTSRSCGFGDPLLPSMDGNQEALDMFGLDNLDFKTPSDTNVLSWDKIDYAT